MRDSLDDKSQLSVIKDKVYRIIQKPFETEGILKAVSVSVLEKSDYDMYLFRNKYQMNKYENEWLIIIDKYVFF